MQITRLGFNSDKPYRYSMIVEYNGKLFAGSQMQPGQRTVQSELEKALSVVLRDNVKAFFSGRTDKGVHSKGQIVHFDSENKLDLNNLNYSLNAILPMDISVPHMIETDKEFHSQLSAKFRWYRYIINNSSQRSVWSGEALNESKPLNLNLMNKALAYIIGEHDFNSFKGSGSTNPARDCIMYKAECKKENNLIFIDLVANRFLYNMIRIIVGTLVPIGKEVNSPESLLYILNMKDRRVAGHTAVANGLTLMHVGYNEKYNTLNLLNKEAINYENLFC
jgi:tRNA pseudouridine38-40 synthase